MTDYDLARSGLFGAIPDGYITDSLLKSNLEPNKVAYGIVIVFHTAGTIIADPTGFVEQIVSVPCNSTVVTRVQVNSVKF
jgi:hypothetical protein